MFRNINHYQELGSPGRGTTTYTINTSNSNAANPGLSKILLCLFSLLALACIATALVFLEASPFFSYWSDDDLLTQQQVGNNNKGGEGNSDMTDEYYTLTSTISEGDQSNVDDDDEVDDDNDVKIIVTKKRDWDKKSTSNGNNNKKPKKNPTSSSDVNKQIDDQNESFDFDNDDDDTNDDVKEEKQEDEKSKDDNNKGDKASSSPQENKSKNNNKDNKVADDDEDENETFMNEVGEPNDNDDNDDGAKNQKQDPNDHDVEQEPTEETKRATMEMEKQLVGLYSPDKQLEGPIYACHENKTKQVRPGTFAHDLLSADCGLGYNYLNSTSKKKPWKVALYGPSFVDQILGLSGCLVGTGKCPYSPRCQIFQTTKTTDAMNADVVVIFQNDAPWIDSLSKRKNQYRVLYWREAFYSAPSVGTQRKFDFEMGVHYQSMILNPQFFRTPTSLLGGITYPHKQVIPFLPLRERKNFAMSAISNCRTASQRNIYINRLSHYLGANRVHQFGRCGDRELPPPPIQNAAKIIATYKFYLAFENTIEDGYVTEKLLHVLAMPIVPVYYGSERTPNVTTIPSYIKVSDFSHPKYLADYLLYLDEHEEEYYKYHLWRTDPKYFHPSFIKTMKMKSPGAYEMLPLRNRGLPFYPRVAACCRLCDENYVRWAKENREDYVQARLTKDQIEHRYFQGDFWGNPTKPNKRQAPNTDELGVEDSNP